MTSLQRYKRNDFPEKITGNLQSEALAISIRIGIDCSAFVAIVAQKYAKFLRVSQRKIRKNLKSPIIDAPILIRVAFAHAKALRFIARRLVKHERIFSRRSVTNAATASADLPVPIAPDSAAVF
jgi:hypothetical protein